MAVKKVKKSKINHLEMLVAGFIIVVGLVALTYAFKSSFGAAKEPELFLSEGKQVTTEQRSCISTCKTKLITTLKAEKRQPTAAESRDSYACAQQCMGDSWGNNGGNNTRSRNTNSNKTDTHIKSTELVACYDGCQNSTLNSNKAELKSCLTSCKNTFVKPYQSQSQSSQIAAQGSQVRACLNSCTPLKQTGQHTKAIQCAQSCLSELK